MLTFYITFRSVTYAQRAESVLRRKGIGCALRRTPKWMEERGCGYCLRVKQQSLGEALGLLRSQAIPYKKVYAQNENGAMEEWTV